MDEDLMYETLTPEEQKMIDEFKPELGPFVWETEPGPDADSLYPPLSPEEEAARKLPLQEMLAYLDRLEKDMRQQ